MKEAAEYFYSDLDYYDRMKKRLISSTFYYCRY
jgi:hypothetical protein